MPTPPTVPESRLAEAGLTLAEESVEVIFELSKVRVTGATRRYEDAAAREALCAATDGEIDRMVRFFAATGLEFRPSLPPGGISAIAPMIRSEAIATFETRLKDRGLVEVRRRRTDRRTVNDATVHLATFAAVDPGAGSRRLPLECWIAVRTDDRPVVVTGGYPAEPLSRSFDLSAGEKRLDRGRAEYREEYFELLAAVG